MKDILAETLLVKVMRWNTGQIRENRPVLQALARFLYDEYQQFSPGMRFIGSLALWLEQFDPTDRQFAYDFMRSNLLFIGDSEIRHLIGTSFPDYIKPILIEEAAYKTSIPTWSVSKAAKSVYYRCLLRQS